MASSPVPAGTRVRLIHMADDPNPIESGAVGTVMGGNDHQLWVKWDNGRRLNLAIPEDTFEIL